MPITIPTYDAESDELVDVTYFTVDEVAGMLPVSSSTIYRYVREGAWPALRIASPGGGHSVYMTKAHIGFIVDSLTQHVGHISEAPPRLGTPVTGADVESIQ